MRPPNPPAEPRCWVYALANGWQVYAGRTDADNDLLSLHFARPDDYWFHVRSLPGSHVLLRGPAGETPGRELLEQAAAVAAWHSKGRQAGSCQVSCTLARHVSKPPKAAPGSVSISREKLLKVRPGLPPAPEKPAEEN